MITLYRCPVGGTGGIFLFTQPRAILKKKKISCELFVCIEVAVFCQEWMSCRGVDIEARGVLGLVCLSVTPPSSKPRGEDPNNNRICPLKGAGGLLHVTVVDQRNSPPAGGRTQTFQTLSFPLHHRCDENGQECFNFLLRRCLRGRSG